MSDTNTPTEETPQAQEPLVLLPAFMSDARVWGPQIEALGGRRTILLPSLATGRTVEEMAETVLAAGPPRFALAGQSLGAMVAMEILRRAPERVSRIALISANCLAETPTAAAERETRIARARAGKLEVVLREDVPPGALAPVTREPLGDFLVEMATSLGLDVYLNHAHAMQRRPDQQKALRSTRIPGLMLCGRHDTIFLPRRHEFMAGLMPKGVFHVVESAGHVPTLEAPDEVTAALQGWLAREVQPLLLK